MTDPLDLTCASTRELWLVGTFVGWLVVYALTYMPRFGPKFRALDKLGWLPEPGYFAGVFHNLRIEFRVRDHKGVWADWRVKDLTERRRAWHWLIHPWLTEDRVLTHVARRVLGARRREGAGGPPAAQTFHHRLLCHILTRSNPEAAVLAVKIYDRDAGVDALYEIEQNLASLPQVHHVA